MMQRAHTGSKKRSVVGLNGLGQVVPRHLQEQALEMAGLPLAYGVLQVGPASQACR